MKKPLVLLLLGLLAGTMPAAATEWTIDPDQSRLTFLATQLRAEFEGRFSSFAPEVQFDPQQPATGLIRASVATRSVDTSNLERDEFLRGPDWFDSERWPEATFVSQTIVANGDGNFMATARLTLRDQTREVRMPFRFVPDPDGESWRMRGYVEVSRLDFGVGQRLWTNTDWVGDAVRVEIDLRLTATP